MSAASPYPPLVLWGDLLSEAPRARRARALLAGLQARLPVVEARRFWPEPGDEPAGGRPLQLADGGRGRTTRTLAGEDELAAIGRAVAATAPAGCPVLALAGPGEDPSDAIRADLCHCGEILLVDPGFAGDGETLAESLRCHWQAHLAEERRDPVELLMTAPVLGPSGYAADARALFLALEGEPGVRLRLRPLRYGREAIDEDPALAAALLEAARRELGPAPMHLQVLLPWQWEPDPEASHDLLRTTWECETLPPPWRALVARADELWLPCAHNLRCFHRSGLPWSRLRRIPEALDSRLFDPARFAPRGRDGRFRFLSVFDWSERKAPAVLLRAFGRSFGPGEAELVLKLHASNGRDTAGLRAEAEALVEAAARAAGHAAPGLRFVEGMVEAAAMPALYAEVDGYVACARGEGWGRPVHEAMAMALPVVTTCYGGTQDLGGAPGVVHEVPGRVVPCGPAAVAENPALRGLSWLEPDEEALGVALRAVVADRDRAAACGQRARRHVQRWFHEWRLGRLCVEALRARRDGTAAERLAVGPGAPARRLLVELEGPVFEASSYAGIARDLGRALRAESELQVQLAPDVEARGPVPVDLAPCLVREPRRPDLVIRSGWPPRRDPPDAGRWIQRFDWEYGAPPVAEACFLAHGPDEVWVHSGFVRDNLLRAGVPADRLRLVPHGVDPDRFHPGLAPLPDLAEACAGRIVFLFVGGPIWRKGADLLLQAWLEAFGPEDPVCLVARLPGTQASYAGQGLAESFRRIARHREAPRLVLCEDDLDEADIGRLYTAADCLVHPYRGEGFGLPLLEAMACGRPVIATAGGAADDFLDPSTWIPLPSREVDLTIDTPCLGPNHAREPEPGALVAALRHFAADPRPWRDAALALAPRVLAERSWTAVVRSVLPELRAAWHRLAQAPTAPAPQALVDGRPFADALRERLCPQPTKLS